MTLEDAFAIQLSLAELEFPVTFSVSIFFALFKVGSKSFSPAVQPDEIPDVWHPLDIKVTSHNRGAIEPQSLI